MKIRLLICSLIVGITPAFIGTAYAATIYKCQENGRVVFSDYPCGKSYESYSYDAHNQGSDWLTMIKSGKQFKVVFDETDNAFDDSVYIGKGDPMGTLKGGETYYVTYQNGSFDCFGYNQEARRNGSWSYANAEIDQHMISLWGRVYRFEQSGSVFDSEYGLVGHLKPVAEGK